MKPVIAIKPAPKSNPEGKLDLPWNIFRDGACTNVGQTRDDAQAKAEKMRVRVDGVWDGVDEYEIPTCPRPRGAPEIGAMVEVLYDEKPIYQGKVISYLATQFLMDLGGGDHRVVSVAGDDWRLHE